MKDQAIIRMIEETSRALSDAPWHIDCTYLMPSYNALLEAAKENHPEDPFLRVLASVQVDEDHQFNATQATILFGQLRMALQSLAGYDDTRDVRREARRERRGRGHHEGRWERPTHRGSVNLSGADLAGIKWEGATLTDANMSGANLRDADLTDANLHGTNLSGADLRGATLRGTNLSHANLSGLSMPGADLSGLDLSELNLSGANLSGTDLVNLLRRMSGPGGEEAGEGMVDENDEEQEPDPQTVQLQARLTREGLDVTGVELDGAVLDGARLAEIHWFGANLRDTDLTDANLEAADLTGANLSGADLAGANLARANLSGADLSGAALPGIDLSDLDLSGESLANATAADVVRLIRRLSAGGERAATDQPALPPRGELPERA
jgi:uncharacterized protein YjbI with pentapeptide repeats